MLEFALVLPLFISIIVGGIDLARFVATHAAVNTAAREATRYASAVGPSAEAVRRYADCSGIRATAQAAASTLNLSPSITIEYEDGDGDGLPSATACPPAPVQADIHRLDRIVVTVSVRFTPIVSLLSPIDIVATDRRTIIKEAS